ncbi:MAG: poly-gamma-glutamate biosynthesis protein PgsC [Desulfobacter sp.]|nr:MAG: poly-gamma-glutamate biosynthesis protein PgsC [Desulfobacter sp.]
MLIEAIAIGLVYGFFFLEWTGLVAGGLIAPGYFALAFDQPWAIALCLLTALASMIAVRLLSFVTILYGRRRFILSVLVAFALQWSVGAMVMGTELAQGRVEVVGYIIPGLVAHEMDRQGVGLTLLSLLVLSCLVFLSLRGIEWMRI